jgi:hypothetical protein
MAFEKNLYLHSPATFLELILTRIFHAAHETPTVRSAGILPAYTLRKSQAGNTLALRTRKCEISGLSVLETAAAQAA